MKRSTIESRLRIALRQLVVDEWSLFSAWVSGRPVSERTICAHLGWHLRPLLSRSWDVDCEYNREGLHAFKRGTDGTQRPADLIVHRRTGDGLDGHNLLMLELKVTDLSAGTGGSPDSVEDLVSRYHYQHGVYLHLGISLIDGEPAIHPRWRWFGNQASHGLDDVFRAETLAKVVAEARHEGSLRSLRLGSRV